MDVAVDQARYEVLAGAVDGGVDIVCVEATDVLAFDDNGLRSSEVNTIEDADIGYSCLTHSRCRTST